MQHTKKNMIIQSMKIEPINEGFLLKAARLREKKEQKEAADGICTVSYLSRIENNQVIPHPDLMGNLLRKAGFETLSEDKKLYYTQKIEKFLESYLEDAETIPASPFTKEEIEEVKRTSFALYIDLIEYILSGKESEELEKFNHLLSIEAEAIFHMHKGAMKMLLEETEKAVELYPTTASYTYYATELWRRKEITKALEAISRAEALMLEDGNIRYFPYIEMLKGGIANYIDPKEAMHHYDKAIKLGRILNHPKLTDQALYNAGASAILDLDDAPLAEKYLSQIQSEEGFLFFHKLFLTYTKLGKEEEARIYLEKMKAAEDVEEKTKEPFIKAAENPDDIEALRLIVDEARKEDNCSFLNCYGRLYINALKQRRMYKEALAISEEISKKAMHFPNKTN